MRDAFGGVFTMNLLLVFIFIYVAVTAVSLNYAKAFRVKNAVIDFIEQNEIYFIKNSEEDPLPKKIYGLFSSDEKDKLDAKLAELSYHVTCEQLRKEDSSKNLSFSQNDEYCFNGVVFKENRREQIEGTDSEIVYYDIKTYANWNLGALNKILALGGKDENSESPIVGTWAINGEAKVVIKK